MADSSSKPVSRHPGMRTLARGIVAVAEKNFSKLLAQCESNEELLKARSFKKMYYAKYGPFTVGDVELEIRMYPVKKDLVEVHVCLLRNAELVNKMFHTLVYYLRDDKLWHVDTGSKGRSPKESDFKAESGSIGEGLGLPMVCLAYFSSTWTEDDHLLFEVALWLVLDDSKKPNPIPNQEAGDSSSKPVSRHPGMRTFAHGIATVVEKNFSKLLEHCQSNEELLKARSFEYLYYAKYGPFTVGDVELEIRMYPVKDNRAEVHVCLLRNAELVNKFFHSLLYYHSGEKVWHLSYAGRDHLLAERDFKAESGSIGEGLGLPMVYLDYFTKYWADNDHVLFEVALWLVLDDSKKTGGKPGGTSTGNTWPEDEENIRGCPFSG